MSLQNGRTEIDQLAVVESTVSQACAIQGTSQRSEVMDQRHVVVPSLAVLLTYRSSILYSLPQELRDEIYKYTFEPRVEIRRSNYWCRHLKLRHASLLAYKSSVVCALLPVSRSTYEEVWRLLVPARDRFINLVDAMMQSKSWERAPLVAAFRPRIRWVCESYHFTGTDGYVFGGVDHYLPESLIVLIDDYVLVDEGLSSDDTDFGLSTWYDELRSLLNLKTFNFHFDTKNIWNLNVEAALQVGKMLLEEKSVQTVNLLFRNRVEESTWQKVVENFFGRVLDTEDVEPTSQYESESLVRRFDAMEAQPWAFENDMPWFTNQEMEQVIRITRCKDTQLEPPTHDRRTKSSRDLHITNQKLMRLKAHENDTFSYMKSNGGEV